MEMRQIPQRNRAKSVGKREFEIVLMGREVCGAKNSLCVKTQFGSCLEVEVTGVFESSHVKTRNECEMYMRDREYKDGGYLPRQWLGNGKIGAAAEW
jgi:hypothetical protein